MSLPKRFARKDLERGQALVLLALAFVGIAAFVGLTVDAGILFTNVGHLRRATDASSLAAANQFREGRGPDELSDMAFEYLELNGLSPSGVVAKICDLDNPGSQYDDPSLCPVGSDTPRKYVNVETTLDVNFAFLPIIGWRSTTIRANSISEAASVDLVLVLDISASMSYNLCGDGIDNDEDGTIDDCSSNNPPDNVGPPNLGGKNSESDVTQCIFNRSLPDDGPGENPAPAPDGDREDDCHPFEEVREAANRLVDRMYFPYDRLGIVTIGRLASAELELDHDDPPAPCGVSPDPSTCAHSVINGLDPVLESNVAADCPNFLVTGDPRGCGSTNTGDGMRIAAGMYCRDDVAYGGNGNGNCDRTEMREEAVWVSLVLSDGVVNAAADVVPPTVPTDWWCPNATWAPPTGTGPPYCQDGDPSTRHPNTDLTNYDADDYARDWADFLGCPSPPNATCLPTTGVDGGQGVVIFTIGLGEDVTNYTEGAPDVDQGEKLLRYIAAVGDDGDPSTDPCSSAAIGADCGNYYFVLDPSGGQLLSVFEAIASRIFTRITH
ncbi:MAG: TadE/TadG family type IV pilus assembly protein [Anaerolineales bacterium]